MSVRRAAPKAVSVWEAGNISRDREMFRGAYVPGDRSRLRAVDQAGTTDADSTSVAWLPPRDMSYPVSITVQTKLDGRNRLTTAFRPILALPHSILVGPVYWSSRSGGFGLIGAAAYVLAVVSWFTLLFTGDQPRGIREFMLYYLRWRTRSLAYMALLRDEYPPFGEGSYAVSIHVEEPAQPRSRDAIALRLLFVVPHLVVLAFLLVAWLITTVLAWFAILFTGAYPSSLYAFGTGVMRWALRVEAYVLLLVDVYPPFNLE
jgi:hypothetical protein